MVGFNTVTGDETIMSADNVSFDGTDRGGKVTTNGQLLIGSTVAPHIRVATLTAGSNVTITNGAGTIQISASSSGGDVSGPASSTDNALVRFDGITGKLIQNGVITEDDTGNLSISAAVSGASLSATVANTSNTASATAFYNAQVAGSTAADAYYKAEISGGQAWTHGLDNSDSDAWVLSANAALGTTNVMRVATTGEINYPLQCAFFAYQASSTGGVTGNSATYTIGASIALTEVYDQNADFNPGNGAGGASTFTAPVTGRYLLTYAIRFGGISGTMVNFASRIITSNRTYRNTQSGAINAVANSTYGNVFVVVADMDAADTATYTCIVTGGAGDTAIVEGSATVDTCVSGFLAC